MLHRNSPPHCCVIYHIACRRVVVGCGAGVVGQQVQRKKIASTVYYTCLSINQKGKRADPHRSTPDQHHLWASATLGLRDFSKGLVVSGFDSAAVAATASVFHGIFFLSCLLHPPSISSSAFSVSITRARDRLILRVPP